MSITTNQATNLTFRNVDIPNGITTSHPHSTLGYKCLSIGIFSNKSITCEIQFGDSENGTFTTTNKLSITSNQETYNNLNIKGSYVRLRFENTGLVGKITCNAILTLASPTTSLHLDNTISIKDNSLLVRPTNNFLVDAINGDIGNIVVEDINGICEGLTNTNNRVFWNLDNNNLPFLNSDGALRARSSSTDDSVVGSGARSVTIEYINNNGGTITRNIATFNMNGTNNVNIGVNGSAIIKASVTSSGGNTNIGNITFEGDSGGGVYQVLNFMPVGLSETKTFFHVPISGENLIINHISYGGTGQFINFIKISKVNINTGVKTILLKEIVDLNTHFSEISCSIKIRGGNEYLIGECIAHSVPPSSDNFFYLTARSFRKDITFQV